MVGLDAKQVTGRASYEELTCLGASAARLENLAQLRYQDLERFRRGLRRIAPPQVVDQAVTREHGVRVQEQDREQRALLGAAQSEWLVVIEDLQRPQYPEFDSHP